MPSLKTSRFLHTLAASAQKKTASEEDGLLTTTNITLNIIQCQS